MNIKNLLLLCLLLISGVAYGQTKYMYVNTDNLIIRDLPEKNYIVYGILHAPSMVQVKDFDDSYYNKKPYTDNFYYVTIDYYDSSVNQGYSVSGYIEKKYMVASVNEITFKKTDPSIVLNFTSADLIRYGGSGENNPNANNRYSFPYPKYKGGDKSITVARNVTTRRYFTGSRGGCYYYNSAGDKVYVSASHCY